jgi:hypothetical protein
MAKFCLEHLCQVLEQKCGPGELSENAIVNIVFGPLTRRANHQFVLQLCKLKEQWVTNNSFPFLLERTQMLIEQLPLGHLSTNFEVMVYVTARFSNRLRAPAAPDKKPVRRILILLDTTSNHLLLIHSSCKIQKLNVS